MTAPFGEYSPADLNEFRQALSEFRDVYVPYLNDTARANYEGGGIQHSTRRTDVMEKALAADRAVCVAGVTVALGPPPVRSHVAPMIGLARVAFAHEDPSFRPPRGFGWDKEEVQSYDLALDAVTAADQALKRRHDAEAKRRRRPSYWVDRGLRAVLGFPGYLISLVFGFDRRDLNAGQSRVLWLLSLVADAGGIWGLGNSLGWW